MKAMILAAGLGTRLRPLTDTRPKALVEISGRTLLEITLTRLRSFGINEVIVNVHHFAGLVVDYLKSHNNFGMHIEISREDDLLLDTGGGLKKASWFFLEDTSHGTDSQPAKSKAKGVIPSEARNPGRASAQSRADQALLASANPNEPFLLHNVDVISTIDFRRMLQFHNEHGALATLAVQSRASSRLLLFNEQNQLVGRAAGQESVSSSNSPLATQHAPLPLAFSGIHIISPRLLPMLTETGVFSIIDSYLRLVAQGEKILAFRADEYYWRDLGRPADLSQAAFDLQQKIHL
ncbi:MAG TPA: nucleotidyltransferase family protein [Candidatus Acidoferrum sp.]|nr:nucleotidyltransferase family protein [Candidatus Acidoferrum sp.]